MVLLDTCALIWLAAAPTRLSPKAQALIHEDPDGIFVSAISAWEIAIKSQQAKLILPTPAGKWYHDVLDYHGIDEIPIVGSIAIASATLPNIHRDPADRLIIATALNRGLPILTPDAHIASYPDVQVMW